MARLHVRQAKDGEDLTTLLPPGTATLRWNPTQVYVGEADGRLVAIALIFDGGHDLVLVDHVKALPAWAGRGVWVQMLRGIMDDMRVQGKKVLFGYATEDVATIARRYGALVESTTYRGLWRAL